MLFKTPVTFKRLPFGTAGHDSADGQPPFIITQHLGNDKTRVRILETDTGYLPGHPGFSQKLDIGHTLPGK